MEKQCNELPSADVGSDHQLVIQIIWLSLKITESPICSRKFNIKKLKNPVAAEAHKAQFAANTDGLLNNGDEVDAMWGKVKSAFNNTATSVLGFASKKRQKKWISA